MPIKRKFRTTPTKHEETHFSLAASGIDRESLRLHNVIGMETGEALGHNVWADKRTLEMVAELGNSKNARASSYAQERGKRTGKEVAKRVRQRFGHPSISEDGTGRTIGSLENFRVEDNKLLHDTQFYSAARLSPAFSGDVVEYIFTLAEEAPEALNESAVLEAALVWVTEHGERELNDDEYDRVDWGTLAVPEDSTTEFPVLRPFWIEHIDLVSDGALTNSLFEDENEADRFFSSAFSGHSSAYGAELFALIDRFRDEYSLTLSEIETKGVEIITRYVFSRRNHNHEQGDKIMAKNKDGINVSQLAFEQDGGDVETVEPVTDAAIVSADETTVTDVETVADEVVIEDSSEEVPATAEDEADIDDDLAEIESIMAETEADEANEAAPPPIETVEALSHVQAQVDELSGVIERQDARIEKITTLLLQQTQQLQAISRNLRRLDGERIVTERVPLVNRRAEDALESIEGDAPQDFTPPLHGYKGQGRVGLRQFSSLIDGETPELVLATDSPSAIAEKAADRRVKRNKQYRMGTRK